MNIQQAAGQVEGAVRAYLARDDEGIYLIPPQMQRPIILMGPPGVGKTAIVSQVAERLGISERTVEAHRSSANQKLRVSTMSEEAAKALKEWGS